MWGSRVKTDENFADTGTRLEKRRSGLRDGAARAGGGAWVGRRRRSMRGGVGKGHGLDACWSQREEDGQLVWLRRKGASRAWSSGCLVSWRAAVRGAKRA